MYVHTHHFWTGYNPTYNRYNRNTPVTISNTIEQAASITGTTKRALQNMADSGIIRAVMDNNGKTLVNEADLSALVTRDQFEHLAGSTVGVAEAGRKYRLALSTVSRWARDGHIRVTGRDGQKLLLAEEDVAYCEAVFRAMGGRSGRRIFDRDGRPYRKKKRG